MKFTILHKALLALGLFCIGLILPDVVQAQASFSDALTEYQDILSWDWRRRALDLALILFLVLAALDIAFFAIGLMFSDKSVPILNTIMKKVIILSIFFTLLLFVWFLDEIVSGFQQFSAYITDNDEVYTEADIVALGFRYFFDIIAPGDGFWDTVWNFVSSRSVVDPFNAVRGQMAVVAGILVLIGFIIIAIQYAYLTIEVMIVLAISPLFMGFLPWRVTRVYPERYLSYIIHLAVKVFLFYIILGFAVTVLELMILNIETSSVGLWEFEFGEHIGLMMMAWLTVALLGQLPGKIAQFITENQNIDLSKLINRIDEL